MARGMISHVPRFHCGEHEILIKLLLSLMYPGFPVCKTQMIDQDMTTINIIFRAEAHYTIRDMYASHSTSAGILVHFNADD